MDEVNGKLDGLIAMMTQHIHGEELSNQELKEKLDEYFRNLDAHTHIYHHDFIGDKIEDQDDSKKFWNKVRESVTEKLIVFVLGAVMSYVCALMWVDFADKINKTPPAQVQQGQVAPPVQPPVKNETPNHP